MARNKRMYVLSLNALSSVLSLLLGFFLHCFLFHGFVAEICETFSKRCTKQTKKRETD